MKKRMRKETHVTSEEEKRLNNFPVTIAACLHHCSLPIENKKRGHVMNVVIQDLLN